MSTLLSYLEAFLALSGATLFGYFLRGWADSLKIGHPEE